MWFFGLTKAKKPESAPEPVPPRVQERVTRLEIEVEELRALVEATWARQRKVEGAVHGMRGKAARWPGRDEDGETFEEFRGRMTRQGLLRATTGAINDGEG